jgi:serine/threonine protein kinase
MVPEERGPYLDQACPDPEIRKYVESLITSYEKAGDFLEEPALRLPANAASAPRESWVEKSVGPYEVVREIGRGGMGVIHKARDTRLGRFVALKFLPVDLARHPQLLERFQREARAASALSHPNICTIYEIGEWKGHPFIAMELLEGETLQQRIGGKPLPVSTLIEYGIQLADALETAHAKGVIHRDIKPANIFVTMRGQVKILDFGLAKLPTGRNKIAGLREASASSTVDGATEESLTSPGVPMGTVAYMSPEQARGEEVDTRTDLFSFGAVLYEMSTGREAFCGATTAVIHDAILNRAPVAITSANPQLPPELERIVNRLLEKDRDLRYQSAADLRSELKRLKRDTDSGVGTAASAVRESARASAQMERGRDVRAKTGEMRTPRRRWQLALAGLLGLIAVPGTTWYLTHRAPPQPGNDLTQRRLTFNTNENAVESVVISSSRPSDPAAPDGRYLAYSDPAGIHVRLLSTGEERLIPRPVGVPAGAYWGVTSWFPDGTQLLADAGEPGGGHHSIWTVSVLGQSARELREGARAWEASPDGTRIAFSPGPTVAGNVREIWVMSSQGDSPQKLLVLEENDSLDNVHWSPDGKRLAYTREPRAPGDWFQAAIETCDLTGAKRTVVVSYARAWGDDYCWLRDGRIVYSREEPAGTFNGALWQVSVNGQTGTPVGRNVSPNGQDFSLGG